MSLLMSVCEQLDAVVSKLPSFAYVAKRLMYIELSKRVVEFLLHMFSVSKSQIVSFLYNLLDIIHYIKEAELSTN